MNVYALTDEDDNSLVWAVASDFIDIHEPCVVVPLSMINGCDKERLVNLIYDSVDSAKQSRAEHTALSIIGCPDGSASYCQVSENLEIDHIKPLSKDGGNEIENLQWLCRPCNLKKGTKHIDFRMNGGLQ